MKLEGVHAPSYVIIVNEIAEFKRVQELTMLHAQVGQKQLAMTKLCNNDCRLNLRELAETRTISYNYVYYI